MEDKQQIVKTEISNSCGASGLQQCDVCAEDFLTDSDLKEHLGDHFEHGFVINIAPKLDIDLTNVEEITLNHDKEINPDNLLDDRDIKLESPQKTASNQQHGDSPATKKRKIRLSGCQKYAICRRKEDFPHATQQEIIAWAKDQLDLVISQSTMSDILKGKDKWLQRGDYYSSSHNKYSLSGYHKHAICRRKEEFPDSTQREIIAWAKDQLEIDISQSTVSDILKVKDKWLQAGNDISQVQRNIVPQTVKSQELRHKFSVTGYQKRAICRRKEEFPESTLKEILAWAKDQLDINVSVPRLWEILKEKDKWLEVGDEGSEVEMSRRIMYLTACQKRAICKRKEEFPSATQQEIIAWAEDQWDLSISQSTMSDILKAKDKWLQGGDDSSRHYRNSLTAFQKGAFCRRKEEFPDLTEQEIIAWAKDQLMIDVSQENFSAYLHNF